MRRRSASNCERSKKNFCPQGSHSLWVVDRIDLSCPAETAWRPVNLRLLTSTPVPCSLQAADANKRASSANAANREARKPRMAAKQKAGDRFPRNALRLPVAGVELAVSLLAGDFRLARGDRQHDPEAHRNHQANEDPHGVHVPEYAAIPQCQECADDQECVADEIDVHESHPDLRAADGSGRSAHAPPGSMRLLLQTDDQRGPTVEAAGFFARVVMLRTFLAVAHGAEPIGPNATAGEVLTHGVRATIAEREVVLRRADAAGVALDLDAQRGILLH